MDNSELNFLKKHYGENFAKLCRELFPTILETPGLLKKIIVENFYPNPALYKDLLQNKYNFKAYVNSFIDSKAMNINTGKSAKELLDEAGYVLYPECLTEDDIQYFKKYYEYGEGLCTFNGGRLDSCRVWFAVKKDVNRIKRQNFKNPERQDEYGTSVISIQFTKENVSSLSIKNRYNHAVLNPDATFGNNLDNIIMGLSYAFCRDYKLKVLNDYNRDTFHLDGYIKAKDGKFYKQSIELNDVYYCANNIVVDENGVKQYDKSKYLLVENYLFDLVNNKVENLNKNKIDGFVDSIGAISKMQISLNEEKNRVIEIYPTVGEKIKIVVNKLNQIISYANSNVQEIGDNFLRYNKTCEEIYLPNVKSIGNSFLFNNENLKNIYCENVENIGSDFVVLSNKLEEINFPKLKNISNCFLTCNRILKKANIPNIETIGDNFLSENRELSELYLPKVYKIKNEFLSNNNKLQSLSFENLIEVGDGFLSCNRILQSFVSPNLTKVGNFFLSTNYGIKNIYFPKVESIGSYFLRNNININSINLSRVKEIGYAFLVENKGLKQIDLQNVQCIGGDFLLKNEIIKSVNLPKLKNIEYGFLRNNTALTEIKLPSVTNIKDDFLSNNSKLKSIMLPKVKTISNNFLEHNNSLAEISLPELEKVGSYFLCNNKKLKVLKAPKLADASIGFLENNKNIKNKFNKEIEEL